MIPSPLVTVVIPTRNRARLLGLTLRSVLRQQEVAFEVIVVDEGSTDDTPAMLAGLGDGRIRVIRHEIPQGVSSARNRGTADARGNWVAFVDDDDLWAPDKLIRQLHAAEAVGSHWAYAGAVSITDGGEIIDGSAPLPPEQMIAALLRHNAIPGGGSNVIVQRTSLERAGTFDSRLDPCEDWDMWIRLGRAGPPAWVCSPLVAYRVHSSNASLNVAAVVRSVRLIESRHGTTIDWGRLHRWLAHSHLRRGERSAAVGRFAKAAVCGELPGVASDLRAILRRRLGSPNPRLQPERRRSENEWRARAAAWLIELERAAP